MVYQVYAGVYRDSKEVWTRFASGALPLAAALVLISLFSFSTRFASGTNPSISAPKNLSLSVNESSHPSAGKPNSNSAGSSSASAQSTTATQSSLSTPAQPVPVLPTTDTPTLPTSSPTIPTSGGLGGGDTSGSDPLPATVTVPPVDVQADGKQILSTTGTTIIIN